MAYYPFTWYFNQKNKLIIAKCNLKWNFSEPEWYNNNNNSRRNPGYAGFGEIKMWAALPL